MKIKATKIFIQEVLETWEEFKRLLRSPWLRSLIMSKWSLLSRKDQKILPDLYQLPLKLMIRLYLIFRIRNQLISRKNANWNSMKKIRQQRFIIDKIMIYFQPKLCEKMHVFCNFCVSPGVKIFICKNVLMLFFQFWN